MCLCMDNKLPQLLYRLAGSMRVGEARLLSLLLVSVSLYDERVPLS